MPTLKHTEVLLDICSKQKTITTPRLAKEVRRLDAQAGRKLDKYKARMDKSITALNKRAQVAETENAELKKKVKSLTIALAKERAKR